MSKKWDSKPALDEHGKPLLNANGKTVLRKSYSVLQDDFFAAMRKAGYDDVERGERGSSEEHLTVTQFKVQQEQARLESIEDTIDRRKQTLEKYNFVFNGGAVNGKLASIIKNQFYAGCVYVELTGYKFAHGHTSKMFFEVNQAVNSG